MGDARGTASAEDEPDAWAILGRRPPGQAGRADSQDEDGP